MSSTVYRIDCLAVRAETVTCRVTVVQVPQPLVPSRSFAFGFLWEGWHQAGQSSDWECGLIDWPGASASEGVRLAQAAAWRRELSDYSWYTDHEDDPRAERYVASVEMTEINDTENNFNYLRDGLERNPVVSAVYAVAMTDARWLDWVRPGMTWDTVAYPPDTEWMGHKRWREELDAPSATISPAWRTETVNALARQMYESRDFSAMPILADALQDAGCDDEDILDHCRAPAPHVRGCWVIELVLGREQH